MRNTGIAKAGLTAAGLAAAGLAAMLLTVSACAKHDDATNTVIINETVPDDPAAADGNGGSPDPAGNDLSANDAAPLNGATPLDNVQ